MARACILLLYDVILVRLALDDFKKKKINDKYSAAILALSVAAMLFMPETSVISRVAGMFVVSVPLMILAILLPGSFGGGDVKLTFVCGGFLGWRLVLEGMMYAILFAGIYCILLIIIKKEHRNVQFAFGPFLSLGFILISKNL